MFPYFLPPPSLILVAPRLVRAYLDFVVGADVVGQAVDWVQSIFAENMGYAAHKIDALWAQRDVVLLPGPVIYADDDVGNLQRFARVISPHIPTAVTLVHCTNWLGMEDSAARDQLAAWNPPLPPTPRFDALGQALVDAVDAFDAEIETPPRPDKD